MNEQVSVLLSYQISGSQDESDYNFKMLFMFVGRNNRNEFYKVKMDIIID